GLGGGAVDQLGARAGEAAGEAAARRRVACLDGDDARETALLALRGVDAHLLALAVLGGEPAAELEVDAAPLDAVDGEAGVVHVRAEDERTAGATLAVGHDGVAGGVLLVGEAAVAGEVADVVAHQASGEGQRGAGQHPAGEVDERDRFGAALGAPPSVGHAGFLPVPDGTWRPA